MKWQFNETQMEKIYLRFLSHLPSFKILNRNNKNLKRDRMKFLISEERGILSGRCSNIRQSHKSKKYLTLPPRVSKHHRQSQIRTQDHKKTDLIKVKGKMSENAIRAFNLQLKEFHWIISQRYSLWVEKNITWNHRLQAKAWSPSHCLGIQMPVTKELLVPNLHACSMQAQFLTISTSLVSRRS